MVAFSRALAEAVSLLLSFIAPFAKLHTTIVRLVNDHFGGYSEKWKVWWVTKGLLNSLKHCCNDHTDCDAYIHYARCVRGDVFYFPKYRYFTDYDQPAYPAGISALAKVLLVGWICGKYMSKILVETVQNPRSSVCESFFHLLDIWLPEP
eukprot:SAG11_NODE_6191_length_1368_cov_1.201734_2_plen_149_part_01